MKCRTTLKKRSATKSKNKIMETWEYLTVPVFFSCMFALLILLEKLFKIQI